MQVVELGLIRSDQSATTSDTADLVALLHDGHVSRFVKTIEDRGRVCSGYYATVIVLSLVPSCAQNCALTAYRSRSLGRGQLRRPKCWKSLCHIGFVILGAIE